MSEKTSEKTSEKMSENKKKRALPIRVLLMIKKIICKLCGRMRWIALAFVIIFGFVIYAAADFTLTRYVGGVRDDDGGTVDHVKLDKVLSFAVNDDGLAIVTCDIGTDGIASVLNLDSGEQLYSNVATVPTETNDSGYIYPKNFAVTDDNEIYSVEVSADDNAYINTETIFRISADDYEYKDSLFDIKYTGSDRIRASHLSRLNYYDGKVTFACIKKDEVKLYSIDTDTRAVTVSDSYTTDANGNYTFAVIPLDGSFLFLRSDGNVYDVEFGKPLGESIYKFDMSGKDGNIFFTKAVKANGKIYVADEKYPTELYCIDNGSIQKVLDIADTESFKDSTIKYIDKYRPEGSDTDKIAICLNNGLLTYEDGKVIDKDITINIHNHFMVFVTEWLTHIAELLLYAMVINLIIRKKTLLYKHLIATIPMLLVITVVIAWNLYDYNFEENNATIEKELGIICELGSEEFDGYDFSQLLETGDNTGKAYTELRDKLNDLSEKKLSKLSSEYIFSVVYRNDKNSAVILARSDMINIPTYTVDQIEFDDGKGANKKHNVVNKVDDFLSDNVKSSSIYAYGSIDDKENSGRFYLKVGTENRSFWLRRRDFILKMYLYFALIFVVITTIIVINSLNVRRTIKKAVKTVEKISEGDLSARIKYKSKDELGEICTQVNKMGQSLETLFEEKDKTERFYYKFVPEKFRELLGKENFTDLTLGDASSRELTVLFCDIRSFSINSEIMTAKENFAFVNVIYGKAGPIIRQNNGFVDKYIGDAVMALFENADDAVRCGTELYRSIVLDPNTAAELKVSDINIGIGIHSGMAMIGIVGESERLSGTVISDTVNLSSRLESLTKQYKTAMLISKDTVDRIADPESLGMRYLGIIQVAGVNEVKAVYEVLDCLPDEQREKRTANSAELREAIRLFHLGRRADAAAALKKIADEGRSDHVTDMYLDFINNLSDDDKGNVFRFVRK